MSTLQSKVSYGGLLLGMWMLGGSVSCYVAAMLAYAVIIPREFIVFLVFTIVGAVSLVVGLALPFPSLKNMAPTDPIKIAMKKPLISLILFTIVCDVVLIVVTYSV